MAVWIYKIGRGRHWFAPSATDFYWAVCCDLDASQLDDFVHSGLQALGILAAGSGEVGLSTTSTLNQLGGLLDQCASLQTGGHEVVAQHHGEHGLALELGAGYEEEAFCYLATQLEGDVLYGVGRQRGTELNQLHAVYLLDFLQQTGLELHLFLCAELLYLLLQAIVLVDVFTDGAGEVRGVVEEGLQVAHRVLEGIEHLLYAGSSVGLDTAYAGGYGALADNLHHADVTRCGDMRTTAELDGVAKLNDAHLVAILLAEEGDGTELACLLNGDVAVLGQGDVGTNLGVDDVLYAANLFIGHLLEVAEVEAQRVGRNE